jgi:hypothetical protein
MEDPRRGSVDPSAALQGLARVADAMTSFRGTAAPDLNAGQGQFRGRMAIGEGLRDLGAARMEISQRVAEIRNRTDLHEGQLAMEKEALEFAKWRESPEGRDPRTWADQWGQRMTKLQGTYASGKKLAPVVQQALNQQFATFAQRQGAQVDVDAVREEVRRGGEAMRAQIMRATEAGDFETAKAAAWEGYNLGLWGEDDATRLELQAKGEVETKVLDALQNQKETAILYGDEQTALATVDVMPIRDDEKELERANITERVGYSKTLRDVEDILDPAERIQRIQSGEFDRLRPSDRQEFLDFSFRELNEEASGKVAALKEEIDLRGGISPLELEGRDDFKALPERSKEAVRQFVTKGVQNDVADFATMLRAARSYDPSADTRGDERANLEQGIALRFSGERAGQLMQALEEAAQRQGPQSATERVASDFFSNLQRRYDSGELGTFRVTGDMISKRKGANGVEVYTIPDPKGQEFPGLLGTYRGRVIQLSEEDRLRFESGKTGEGDFFEDLGAKEAAFSKFLNVQQEIEAKIAGGELTDPEAIQAEANRLIGDELGKAFETKIQRDGAGTMLPGASFGQPSNALFPNPDRDLEWLNSLDLEGYATF